MPATSPQSTLAPGLGYPLSTIALLVVSSLVLCLATIAYQGQADIVAEGVLIGNQVMLAVGVLMPYMISAAVAAITAAAVMNLLPWVRLPRDMCVVQARLREMAAGDMAARIRVRGNNEASLRLARELNAAIGELGSLLARWKLLDRGQWDCLEAIRIAAEHGDVAAVRRSVALLQQNFDKIAEMHQQIIC